MGITVSLPQKACYVTCWPIEDADKGVSFYAKEVLVNSSVDSWVFIGDQGNVVAMLPRSWVFKAEADMRDATYECRGLPCVYSEGMGFLTKREEKL